MRGASAKKKLSVSMKMIWKHILVGSYLSKTKSISELKQKAFVLLFIKRAGPFFGTSGIFSKYSLRLSTILNAIMV